MESVHGSALPPPPVLPAGEYEVFLSFRGPDVRNTFADHLYTSLARSKVRVFRDEEELRKGEGIADSLFRAIPETKIYIPILTEQYASSKWCLQELAQMVECWKLRKGHLILPVFYFVDPRDVRHQQGPYLQAFEQHAQKHSQQTVEEWKEALQEVGQMKGWHVTDSHRQGAVVEEVLSEIELRLRSIYSLVTDELVGMDAHVEEVMKLMNLGCSEGIVVGIHGMGGLGKTTLSKAVYNKISGQFDRSCFLEDVRERLTKSDGVLSLQNQVISSILKDDYKVKNVSQGINMIKERVCKQKVLVVVDDIDEKFEFDKILGRLGDFSLDSRFIFTTRYRRALDFIPNCRLYETEEMSRPLSLQLFSKHAFGMDNPPEEYVGMSEEFVKVAAGLPLALKVIGSLLFRRGPRFWEEKLIQLQGIPSTTENKVQERLKISYNDLTNNEKQIFLDIACFFIGSDKDLPYYMWSGCEFYPESGISTLIHRSLIKLDERNQFWMHDHIRDLGRAIVKEEDVRHPYNRSRIWSTDDALDMLRNGEGSEHVEVLTMDVKSRDDHERLFKSKKFEKLPGLRYLEVRYGNMMGNFREILPNICCLRLHQCGSIPTDVNAKKLTVLDLEGCNVTNDWKGWSGIKSAGKLKALNLVKCYELNRAPDLSTCGGLEVINVQNCSKMEGGLHIDNFKNLKTLRLFDTDIRELTVKGGNIGKLQRLEEMDLRSTSQLRELPPGMESLFSLKILLLGSGSWTEIPRLPTSLKMLTISTPSEVPNLLELKELESLSYLGARSPQIPGELWRLPNLKEFTLKQSPVFGPLLQIEETSPAAAAALPPSLTSLLVEDCGPLSELPNVANLQNVTNLKLSNIRAVEIQGLGGMTALKTMWISDFPNLNNLNGLENLSLLTTLFVGRCAALERLPSLTNLIKLKDLTVDQCPILAEIEGLGDLGESLSSLEITRCPSFTNFGTGLQHLAALEDFTFEEEWFSPHCKTFMKQFPDVSGLVNLKRLNIRGCPGLIEVIGLDKLVLLESLTIRGCAIRQLPDLSGLENLKRFDLNDCENLINPVLGIDRMESLRLLRMYGCSSITKLPNLSRLKNLETLNLSKCTALTEVEGIEGLESLTVLRMFDCRSLKELGDLSGLKNLKDVNIVGCTKLSKVDGVAQLEGSGRVEMGKRMRVKNLAKSAARQGKELASRFLGL